MGFSADTTIAAVQTTSLTGGTLTLPSKAAGMRNYGKASDGFVRLVLLGVWFLVFWL